MEMTEERIIYPFERKSDPDEIRKGAIEYIKDMDSKCAAVLKALCPVWANHEFVSVMVSRDNRFECKFSKPPSFQEVNRAVNILRVQLEILKENEPKETEDDKS